MARRHRRRLSRWSYVLLGVATGATSSAMIGAFDPWSWQAILSYAAIVVVSVSARRADQWIAQAARRLVSNTMPRPVDRRPDPGRPESWCGEGVAHDHGACGDRWNPADPRDVEIARRWRPAPEPVSGRMDW